VHASILYTCLLCGKNIKAHKNYKLHVANHNTETPGLLKCLYPKCKILFKKVSDLQNHTKEAHEDVRKLHCNECDKLFAKKANLALHITNHWDWRPFKCDIPGCSYSAKVSYNLQRHKDVVHAMDLSPCSYCGRMFKDRVKCKKHEEKHKTDTPGVFKCHHMDCQEFFSAPIDLRTHIEQHKFQKCDVPGCLFTSKVIRDLNAHRRKAHSIFVHNCKLCDKCFDQSSHLKRHMQFHKTREPGVFKCAKKHCKQSFISVAEFKKHLDNHESLFLQQNVSKLNTKKFECHLCSKIIKGSRSQFQGHILTHETGTPGVMKCIHQGCKQKQTFTSATDLKQHALQHWNVSLRPFACDFPQCIYASKTDKDRLNHKRRVHSSKFYNCQMCGRQFKHLAYVTQHIKRQHKNQMNAENPNFTANVSQEIVCKDEIEEMIVD
jgi:KRAB domain-containing zinc finger protein